jgi:hypothetical protein
VNRLPLHIAWLLLSERIELRFTKSTSKVTNEMSLLLGGSHTQQQCMRAQRAAEAQPMRQAVQSCRAPKAQLLQQHALVSRPQQLESSHSRCVAGCVAQIKSTEQALAAAVAASLQPYQQRAEQQHRLLAL